MSTGKNSGETMPGWKVIIAILQIVALLVYSQGMAGAWAPGLSSGHRDSAGVVASVDDLARGHDYFGDMELAEDCGKMALKAETTLSPPRPRDIMARASCCSTGGSVHVVLAASGTVLAPGDKHVHTDGSFQFTYTGWIDQPRPQPPKSAIS